MTDLPQVPGSGSAALRLPADPALGYFGPGSATWKVMADPAAGPGGIAALFTQALHPRALAGVDQHSDFRTQFWPRLARTAEYVMTVTYGPRDEVDRIAGHVRAAHEHVRGVDPVTGRTYAASEPDLLRWVHVTEVHGFLDAVQRAGGGLTDDEADRFLAEQVRAAELLGATDVPASRAEVAAYFEAVRPELRASATSRSGALRLLAPPMPTKVALATPARPAWTALATLGFALQPRWARRMHGLPGLPTTDLAAGLAIRALRTTVLALPETWLRGPVAREALAKEKALLGTAA
ncbi:oxygenase MpaB family protein [Actinomycetospora chiangmaiensis]|uniref:oxygenase MpaB family protein n=1 Tax=Actinomycetospora chiangmaiensis TaxID=402650 RepID=UPI00035FBE65|nr:oxygenase MpaB family protein [Actinomycetospora chiangmaiensis]